MYIYARPSLNIAPTPLAAQLSDEHPAIFTGALTPAEIMVCDAIVKQQCIEVGIIKDGICIDAAVFQGLETAENFLADGVWPEADAVVELPTGYGIGDLYDGEIWTVGDTLDDTPIEDDALDTPPEELE